MHSRLAHRTALLLVLTCLGAWDLQAAEHRGLVNFGGLPVPGATVTAFQGEKRMVAITDTRGRYSFPDLEDGAWIIEVEMLCFAPSRKEVDVAAGAPDLEWELKLLPVDEIKTVSNAPVMPAVLARPADVAGSTAKGAPRPAAEPAKLVPANPPGLFQRTDLNAVNPASSAATPESEAGTMAGQSLDELAQRAADGLVVSGSVFNAASSAFGQVPAFGNNRKGPRSLYTGSFGLNLGNAALDARPYSFTGQNMAQPAYNRLTGVTSFGGPLKIPPFAVRVPNFTVSYQWTRDRNANLQPGLMPSSQLRSGDFSQVFNALGQPVRIFDPLTGQQFPGSVIPSGRISPAARALLDLYPLPGFSGGEKYNFQAATPSNQSQDRVDVRLAQTINPKNHLTFVFVYQNGRGGNQNLFGFLDKTGSRSLSSNISLKHNFTARLISNIAYGFSRSKVEVKPFFQNRRNVSGEAGISGNLQDPMNWGPPDLAFTGGITPLWSTKPSFNRFQTSTVSNGMFWGRGRHSLQFGGDFARRQFNYLSQQNPRGTFTFTGAATQARVNGLPVAGTGSDFADFLLGIPGTLSIAYGNADKYFRASSVNAYLTDNIKVHPGLTVNVGIRWEYGSPISELRGRLVNLDIAPGFGAVAPVLGSHPVGSLTGRNYPGSLLHPDRSAFQPRLGMAWRPFPVSSLVIRAGYGIYFNKFDYLPVVQQMAQQSPLSKSLSLQNSPGSPLTLVNGFNAPPPITATAFSVDPNLRVGYAQNWQLSIQQDLPSALVLAANYLGTRGIRGTQQFLPNTFPVGAVNPCPKCPTGYTYLTSNGHSSRHAGQVELRRRFLHGFGASLVYTYSKALDDAALGGWGPGTSGIAQDWLDLGAERGLSSFHQRHAMNLQMQYATGMGRGGGALMGGWMGRLYKGWTITSNITSGSGFPLTPVYQMAVQGTGVTGSIRPNATGLSPYDAPAGRFLNPAAYAAPAPGSWGNAGRNTIIGPTRFTMNASMSRSFQFNDRVMIDLRVDSANTINRVAFPGWNTSVTSSQFGLPGTAMPMRTLQVNLRARF